MPPRFISIPITKIYYAIGFDDLNIWAERFNEIIDGLISGGIINNILERMTKSKWNLMKVNEGESEKIVLNLSHLGFGFQICFCALYAALVIFILEFFVFWVKNCSKAIKKSDRTKVSARIETEEVFGEKVESSFQDNTKNEVALFLWDLMEQNYES